MSPLKRSWKWWRHRGKCSFCFDSGLFQSFYNPRNSLLPIGYYPSHNVKCIVIQLHKDWNTGRPVMMRAEEYIPERSLCSVFGRISFFLHSAQSFCLFYPHCEKRKGKNRLRPAPRISQYSHFNIVRKCSFPYRTCSSRRTRPLLLSYIVSNAVKWGGK